ncbi:hypothetical protein VUR80DRAFT_6898 [Thermomyces stellatus]
MLVVEAAAGRVPLNYLVAHRDVTAPTSTLGACINDGVPRRCVQQRSVMICRPSKLASQAKENKNCESGGSEGARSRYVSNDADTQMGNGRWQYVDDQVVVRRRLNPQEVQGSYISRQGKLTSKAGVELGSRGWPEGEGTMSKEAHSELTGMRGRSGTDKSGYDQV